jgi:signal transduction histidine kinase
VFRRDRSSLRARITLVASAFAALIYVSVGVFVVIAVRGREAAYAREQVTESSERVLTLVKRGALPSVLTHSGDELIQVLDSHGRVMAATPKIVGKPPMATFQPTGGALRDARRLCPPAGLDGCMTVVAYRIYQPGGDWVVYNATPVLPWYVNSNLVAFLSAVGLLMVAMVAAFTSRAVAKTLTPVDAIRTELAEITASDLDRRVPVPKNQDEIRMLAETVNDTLDRLEAAYEQLRHFTSDASHDLRSPITAMRTQLEEALMYPNDTDWPRMTQAVLCGVERLQALVTDLLAIARLDAGAPLVRDPTDLAQFVGGELDRRPCAVKVVRRLQKGVFARCDRMRLSRLLTNLMDNAERHATSQITVNVRTQDSMAIVEVIDDGAGIAADLREVIFKRFTRLDASRSRDAGGTGLGLAIARQIAESHDGTLTLEDSERGARFVLRLPKCTQPLRF